MIVNDDGVHRLGRIRRIEGEWVYVFLTGFGHVRRFWVEQVKPV